jgi:chromosome segregation ATPase
MTNGEYQQLVEFLGKQFAEIDRRFTEMDGRFTAIDGRFTAMDRRLTEMDQRSTARFDAIDEQLRAILGHLDHLYGRLERLEQESQAVLQGLRRIEAFMADETGRREILERGLDELKFHVVALQARIEALERRLRE